MLAIGIRMYTVLDSWWWAENLSETCRVLFQKQIWVISASSWFYYKNTSQCTVLWISKPKVHYRNHKCPPPVRILSQLVPAQTPHPTFWRSILILSSHFCLGLPSGLFPSGFPTKTLYMPLLSHTSTACPALLILHDIIIQILGEKSDR